MEKEFATYEQALALKELGFDDDVLAWYDAENKLLNTGSLWQLFKNDDDFVLAPLKQQVFRWFREKHEWYANLSSWIHEEEIGIYHEFEIYGTPNSAHGSIPFKTYEEAENACIDKLIEIAKQQDND
jgi:hypothetical protein